mmetsp:Transcript_31984/g.66749  ORF Transcript_31984/g.66749 Transcript_31984/m.66749 type:complete len:200 (-) Transcript_31984:150-749(-)|eukprot:CAMPEP_0172459266 /NCGR_PEP_ID=MMETSP1065-20121228/31806_1 /TAXON_ID=265537 /ORGANISM="Amphiprora paludosa, Strain CCMP125" /LENGTH=199 /DNA_ID=CAMNT_0013213883 /DNA_START=69 /DNA_END=668 /DNA_ORIENTATION=-
MSLSINNKNSEVASPAASQIAHDSFILAMPPLHLQAKKFHPIEIGMKSELYLPTLSSTDDNEEMGLSLQPRTSFDDALNSTCMVLDFENGMEHDLFQPQQAEQDSSSVPCALLETNTFSIGEDESMSSNLEMPSFPDLQDDCHNDSATWLTCTDSSLSGGSSQGSSDEEEDLEEPLRLRPKFETERSMEDCTLLGLVGI